MRLVQKTGAGHPPQLPAAASMASSTAPPLASRRSVRPSFDCAKARTRIEFQICGDGHLADLEVRMAAAYRLALSRVPSDRQLVLRREHLAWFKDYGHTCNQIVGEGERAACIANHLSAHTLELNQWQ